MILDAMSDIRADGLAYVEAHPDLEVFRLRLGNALNFTFGEDTQSLLFKRKDYREGAQPTLLAIDNDLKKGFNRWSVSRH